LDAPHVTSAKPKLLIRTNDVAEIIESVSSVYCHHAVKVLERDRRREQPVHRCAEARGRGRLGRPASTMTVLAA